MIPAETIRMAEQEAADRASAHQSDAAEIARLRKGIQDYLDGNYPHPRSFRPGQCPHGLFYYNECEQCTDDHFQKLLKPAVR